MQIICLGDSITDCNHLFEDFPLGNGYVQMLSEMFKKETSFNNVQIKNYGFDGFTVARVLDNIRQHRISLHRSPVVTLLIGINDVSRGTSADTIVNRIGMITQKIKQDSPKTKLYLQSVLPVTDHYKMFGGHTSRWQEVKKINEGLMDWTLALRQPR